MADNTNFLHSPHNSNAGDLLLKCTPERCNDGAVIVMESFNLDLDETAELGAHEASNSRAHIKVKKLGIKGIDLER